MPARRLSPKGMDMRLCVSKDARPRRGWIGGSHIDLRKGISASKDAEL